MYLHITAEHLWMKEILVCLKEERDIYTKNVLLRNRYAKSNQFHQKDPLVNGSRLSEKRSRFPPPNRLFKDFFLQEVSLNFLVPLERT